MLLSIIIPIYNVENYIKKCLDSIYNQHVDESLYEIIAVNDGSPDNSSLIVEDYIKSHSNLKLINKENGGVSSARNLGLNISSGDFVIYIDPDDYIANNTLDKLILCILENINKEIIIFRSHISGTNNEKYAWKHIFKEVKEYSGNDLFYKNYNRGSVCGVAFKRYFLEENKIAFIEGMKIMEDSTFFAFCQVFANKISFKDISFYRVCIRNDSASRSRNKQVMLNKLNDSLEYIYKHKDVFHDKSETAKSIFNLLIYRTIAFAIFIASQNGILSYKEVLKFINIHRFLPLSLAGIKYKRVQIQILNFSPFLFYCLYIIRRFK